MPTSTSTNRGCGFWLTGLVALIAVLIGAGAIYWGPARWDRGPLRKLESDPMFGYNPPQAIGSDVTARRDHLAHVPPLDDFDEQPSEIEASVVRRIQLDPNTDVDRYLETRHVIITAARRAGWTEQHDSFAKWTATKTIDGMPASLSVYYNQESWWSGATRFGKDDLARALETSAQITVAFEERSPMGVQAEALSARSDRDSDAQAARGLSTLSTEIRRVAAAVRKSDGSPAATRRIGSAAELARTRLLEERAREMAAGSTSARLAADQLTLLQLTQLTYIIRAARADDPHELATSVAAAQPFVAAQRSLAGSVRARGLTAPRPADYPRITGRAFSSAPRDTAWLSDRRRYEVAMTAILAEHQAQLGLASGRDVFYRRSLGQKPRSKRQLRATARRLRTEAVPPAGAARLHRQIIEAFDAAARAEALARKDEAAARRASTGDGEPPQSSVDGRRTHVIERSNQLNRVDDLVARLKSRGYAIGVERTAVQLASGLRPPNPPHPEVYPP